MNEHIFEYLIKNEKATGAKISLVFGDITKLEVDAIVNAAHEEMSGGGGVDGAIHDAAGETMTGECLNLYGCPIGEARMTGGYKLPAKYIIHTVGPTWRNDKHRERFYLGKCYRSCMKFAEMQGLKTIAFPCISAGAYAFPADIAADIAVETVASFLAVQDRSLDDSGSLEGSGSYIKEVTFCCFDKFNYDIYYNLLTTNCKDRFVI